MKSPFSLHNSRLSSLSLSHRKQFAIPNFTQSRNRVGETTEERETAGREKEEEKKRGNWKEIRKGKRLLKILTGILLRHLLLPHLSLLPL